MKIALLGAESTGKSQLVQDLAARFKALGLPVVQVSEYLREWCDQHQRTPEQHEQADVAHTQMSRILQAPEDHLVLADTTPLMTAVYSQMVFSDDSLNAQALAWQQQFDITLLTGLDLPWVADGLQRDGAHVREPVDQKIRHMLGMAGVPFQVIYGQGPQRLANTLYCIASAAAQLDSPMAKQLCQALSRPETLPQWTGPCETCGDGECEHRLFTRLLN
jgi:nicotinamide riboside kinase